MTKSVESVTGDLADDLATLRGDIGKLAEAVGQLARRQTELAGGRFSETAQDVGDRILGTAMDVQKRVRAAGVDVGASIERHPLPTVLIALGVGLSIWMLVRQQVR
jgi:ElaB/YqjD/DUF883 family membrane-anchored ribosome-binding protein